MATTVLAKCGRTGAIYKGEGWGGGGLKIQYGHNQDELLIAS